MTLQAFLVWVLSGVGSGAISYQVMSWVEGRFSLSAEAKRYLSLGLAGAVAVLAYVVSVVVGYEAQPVDIQAWVESIFSVVAISVGFSQSIHGYVKLKSK